MYFIEMYKNMFLILELDHTKDFKYIMDYALKGLEMYFQWYSMIFNTFHQSLKMFMHSVCLSVHTLTLESILQISSNLYMLFMSYIE